MRIWVDIWVLISRTLDLHSNLGKPSLAKPSQAGRVGSPPGWLQSLWLREDVELVYFRKEARMTHSQQHRQHHSHSSMSKQAIIGKPSGNRHNNTAFVCTELIPYFNLQVKNKPWSQWELCVYYWERCCCKQICHEHCGALGLKWDCGAATLQ